ncbi:flagellar biosynthetic protein FliR [Halanaerocella petrolearia]
MNEQQLLRWIYYVSLVITRIIGLFVIAPIFGSKALPRRLKVGMIVILAILLINIIPLPEGRIPELGILGLELITEFIIGLIMGFILSLIFTAIQLAGQFIDRRMGFAMANILDPQSGTQVPLVGQYKNILATLVFLSFNGHHKILKLLAKSFELIKLGQFHSSIDLFNLLLRIIGDLIPLGFRIALPLLATLFIVDLAFGLIARTVPQLNIFILGLPLKLFVGLLMLIITLPNYISLLEDVFGEGFSNLYNVLELIGK